MNSGYQWVGKVAFLCALLGFVGLKTQAQTYAFGTASYAAPGISPNSIVTQIVTADFNADGIPDVAMLGTIPNGQALSIFLGKPDGSFGSRVDYSLQATAQPSGFTVGDFNGDGKLDVIVINSIFSPPAIIFFGNGDGTLQPAVPLDLGSGYAAGLCGDFNADGKLDLLLMAPGSGGGAVAIFFGNGDGTFQAPVTYSVPAASYLAMGDFNGDGNLDIASAGAGSGSGEVSILINNGDGTFKSPVNYSIAGNVQALATADFNGDGKLDLVVPSGGYSAAIYVLLGNGDGSFGNPIEYDSNLLSIYSASIAVADFNRDGKLDLALTNTDSNVVALVLGNGDGTFQNPPVLYSGGLLPSAVVNLDVNGDGKPDLAVAGGYGVLSYFSLTTLINRGDGIFPNPVNYPVLQYPYSAVVGDFNSDGNLDIATTSYTQTGGVSVLLGKGDGSFQPHLDSPTGQSLSGQPATGQFPRAIVAGDFNGDGKLDLVVTDYQQTALGQNYQQLSTLIGNGDGTFQDNISQTVAGVFESIAVGDFNGDEKLDIAAVGVNTTSVSIFLGQGDGSFAAPVQYSTGPMLESPPFHNVLVGDFNGDNKLDLAIATDNGIAVLLGNGNGTFQPFSLVPSLLSYDPGDDLLALADFNGDGKLDIVKATQNGIINVALGNGDGTFQQAPSFQIPSILNTESAVVGDFNGDGKPDLAFASQSSDVVTILFGKGDGSFTGHIEYSVPTVSATVNFMLAADFNGDGAIDMALADFGSAEVSVLVNQPVAAFAPRALTFANQGIGTTSPEQSVMLTNAGAAPLRITSVAASGDFAETNNCGPSVSTEKACTVDVTFTPTNDGVRSGMLSFKDNASVVPQTLVLSGTGTGPAFEITVASGSSASQTVTAGQTASYSLVFTPEDGFNGTVTLTCSGAPSGANCAATPSSLSLSGTSGVAATIKVATTAAAFAPLVPKSTPARPVSLRLRFNPRSVVLLTGMVLVLALLVTISGRATPSKWLAPTAATMGIFLWAGCGGGGGSGSKVGPPAAPLATISPSSLNFNSENQGSTSPTQNVMLTNPGNAALSIRGISVGGTNSGDFGETSSCGSSLLAGGNCAIGVTFNPTATGPRSATLSIADNASGSPQSVNLAGTGVPAATAAGSYTIMVTATSGTLVQTIGLSLTVQ
jgi:FG-GAP-like repeat/FG-GAP repeat